MPAGNSTIAAGRTPVAGVAWAQHKGVAAVEVRVDRGPWQEAQLAAVPDIDTWRQWVWMWDAAPGNHLLEARATDATGYTQTAADRPAHAERGPAATPPRPSPCVPRYGWAGRRGGVMDSEADGEFATLAAGVSRRPERNAIRAWPPAWATTGSTTGARARRVRARAG